MGVKARFEKPIHPMMSEYRSFSCTEAQHARKLCCVLAPDVCSGHIISYIIRPSDVYSMTSPPYDGVSTSSSKDICGL